MKLKNRKPNGFSLVEAIISALIVGLLAMFVADGLRTLNQSTSRTKDARNKERIIGSLLQNITENIATLPRSFDPSTTVKEDWLKPETLPLAWDQNQIVSIATCPNCAGRVGFYIEVLSGIGQRGLNRLTVRITHKTLFKGYEDYVFILSDQ